MGRLIARLLMLSPGFLHWFLAVLERLGRKKILVNFDGTIAVQRWYLLYLEDDEDHRFIARFPNAYLHVDLKLETPDSSHHHAWNTYSLVLKGGYVEEVDGVQKTFKVGDLVKLRYDQHHRLVSCEPGTITLFMHGWRRGPWAFKLKPCVKLCDTCATKYGRCVNEIKETAYKENVDVTGDWRMTAWFLSNTPGLKEKLARRRRSLGKVKVLSREEVLSQAAKRLEG